MTFLDFLRKSWHNKPTLSQELASRLLKCSLIAAKMMKRKPWAKETKDSGSPKMMTRNKLQKKMSRKT